MQSINVVDHKKACSCSTLAQQFVITRLSSFSLMCYGLVERSSGEGVIRIGASFSWQLCGFSKNNAAATRSLPHDESPLDSRKYECSTMQSKFVHSPTFLFSLFVLVSMVPLLCQFQPLLLNLERLLTMHSCNTNCL